VVNRVSLAPVIDRLIRNLSKGFQQRVGLAQALLGNPPVLILDEPTVGLDPRQIGEVRALIAELAGEHTVILSTHILQEVTATCKRVIFINQGRIVADDSLSDLVRKYRREEREASLEEIFLSLTEV
ncbi:MAG: ATP-binding cassette domain-containing protein, partial [Oxalobacteraceae bacterium]